MFPTPALPNLLKGILHIDKEERQQQTKELRKE
jgi:hypothetical protein